MRYYCPKYCYQLEITNYEGQLHWTINTVMAFCNEFQVFQTNYISNWEQMKHDIGTWKLECKYDFDKKKGINKKIYLNQGNNHCAPPGLRADCVSNITARVDHCAAVHWVSGEASAQLVNTHSSPHHMWAHPWHPKEIGRNLAACQEEMILDFVQSIE